jgi:hypothetical protein
MKNTDQKSKVSPASSSPAANALQNKVTTTEKSVQKAWTDYEKKNAAYEDAFNLQADKITLAGLWAAAKIARFVHKIKRVEYKMAKVNLKDFVKSAKKAEQKANKDTAKHTSKKVNRKTLKDSAAKEKNILETRPSASSKTGKKKAAV